MRKPLKLCASSPCRNLTRSRFCPDHTKQQGGYGRPWRRQRMRVLQRDPWCRIDGPGCEMASVHVDLPACLSWLRGGGLVKRFTVDFVGRDEVHIPLAVTGAAPGGQHFAVCVRNMFEEERRANPGLVRVATELTA